MTETVVNQTPRLLFVSRLYISLFSIFQTTFLELDHFYSEVLQILPEQGGGNSLVWSTFRTRIVQNQQNLSTVNVLMDTLISNTDLSFEDFVQLLNDAQFSFQPVLEFVQLMNILKSYLIMSSPTNPANWTNLSLHDHEKFESVFQSLHDKMDQMSIFSSRTIQTIYNYSGTPLEPIASLISRDLDQTYKNIKMYNNKLIFMFMKESSSIQDQGILPQTPFCKTTETMDGLVQELARLYTIFSQLQQSLRSS